MNILDCYVASLRAHEGLEVEIDDCIKCGSGTIVFPKLFENRFPDDYFKDKALRLSNSLPSAFRSHTEKTRIKKGGEIFGFIFVF
jgi:hypothetical protein